MIIDLNALQIYMVNICFVCNWVLREIPVSVSYILRNSDWNWLTSRIQSWFQNFSICCLKVHIMAAGN